MPSGLMLNFTTMCAVTDRLSSVRFPPVKTGVVKNAIGNTLGIVGSLLQLGKNLPLTDKSD